MPYKTNEELPKSIKKLPQKAQTMFRKAFNSAYAKYEDEEKSFQIAWALVKKHFKKKNGEWVAQSMGYELFTFELENTGDVFIQQSNDGNYYMEAMLADTLPTTEGWAFTEETLRDFANQINTHGIMGGITHREYQDLLIKYSHLPADEFVQHARTERKGIIKSVKAIYENGKLWVKALIDKRYINHAKKFNKVSLEAWIPKKFQKGMKYLGGKILGLALDNRPKNPRTSVKFD